MMIVNELRYPWLAAAAISAPFTHQQQQQQQQTSFAGDDWSPEGHAAIETARLQLKNHGAAIFPDFLTTTSIESAVQEMLSCEDDAFLTDTKHTPYLKETDFKSGRYKPNSIYNHETKTICASTAYDELSEDSVLKQLYNDPRLLQMVSSIVLNNNENENDGNDDLYLSEDPLGCCTVNVFRPNYFHGFHYDEHEFSVTIMLQDAEDPTSGLFQHTNPIRQRKADEADDIDLALERTADAFREYDASDDDDDDGKVFAEHEHDYRHTSLNSSGPPSTTTTTTTDAPLLLHTLDFRPGTLLVLAGSKSLHRVTKVKGNRSRFVAVLTFAPHPHFRNTPKVRKMFWGGRPADDDDNDNDDDDDNDDSTSTSAPSATFNITA